MDDATARSLIEQAEAARVRMRGRDDASTIAAVEAEYPAMREALDWLLDRDHPEDAFRLASALVPFWLATKRIDDGMGAAAGDGGGPEVRHVPFSRARTPYAARDTFAAVARASRPSSGTRFCIRYLGP